MQPLQHKDLLGRRVKIELSRDRTYYPNDSYYVGKEGEIVAVWTHESEIRFLVLLDDGHMYQSNFWPLKILTGVNPPEGSPPEGYGEPFQLKKKEGVNLEALMEEAFKRAGM